jgi:hypothetical protein
MELGVTFGWAVVMAAEAGAYGLGENDFASQRVYEVDGKHGIRSGAIYGGKYEYSTCMHRPDHRRIDGCYSASNSLGGPIE